MKPRFICHMLIGPLPLAVFSAAVKNRRVGPVPQPPHPWFDRPPGTNRITGIPWTAKILYPDAFGDMDLPGPTRKCYTRSCHYDHTDSETDSLRDPSLR